MAGVNLVSANFNIVMFTKSKINLNRLLGVVHEKGFNPLFTKIKSVGNWDFEDLQIHKQESDPAEINMLMDSGRITLIFGAVQSIKFVVILNKLETIYETSISFDTKNMDYLDNNTLNDKSRPVYDEITSILLRSGMVNDLLISALGVEVIVDYIDNFNKIILNSHNVMRWVGGIEKDISEIKGYKQVSAGIWDKAD
ncbi:hypothetical protein [Paenibacillus sp. MMS20-IR301]|uniref:hypothetical protein n=1 Tax=Paenibacillus sp. MMS20-IR301 TaxID=2895946 RepID=UPI0028E82231|nr:hypothetical protein [Paenibacillus sp. MMS20-IR301]WNS45873.1 hypothetical protein LOS79_11565 [Paenibacillus sp. MMS20-IR301]